MPSRLQQFIKTAPGVEAPAPEAQPEVRAQPTQPPQPLPTRPAMEALEGKPGADTMPAGMISPLFGEPVPPWLKEQLDATIRPGQLSAQPASDGQATILMGPGQPLPVPPDLAIARTVLLAPSQPIPPPKDLSPQELASAMTIIRPSAQLKPAALEDLQTDPRVRRPPTPLPAAAPKAEAPRPAEQNAAPPKLAPQALQPTTFAPVKARRVSPVLWVLGGALAIALGFGTVALVRQLSLPESSAIVEVAEPGAAAAPEAAAPEAPAAPEALPPAKEPAP